MNNELFINGFSSIAEDELVNVTGGFDISMACMSAVCAASTVTVVKSATYIAAMTNPVIAGIVVGGYAAATIYYAYKAVKN